MKIGEVIAKDLPPLPAQPADVPWPTANWVRGEAPGKPVVQLADEIFDPSSPYGTTYALLIVQGGKLIYERYDAGADDWHLQYSWSIAKSITHALVSILVEQGKLDLFGAAPIPEWAHDERSRITLDQLLRMSSGLEFVEDYEDGEVSDAIRMLFEEGRHDTGAYAAAKPLLHPSGSVWSYSSGTTNILCRILKEVVGGGASGMLRFMNDALFEPIGVRSATPKFDTSGTFIGSSYLLATPLDFARIGLLYLRGGTWDGKQIVSRDWIDYARSPTYRDDEQCYGAHWWLRPDKPAWFSALGFEGQRLLCIPEKDAVILRLGRTPEDAIAYLWERIYAIGEEL